MAGRSVTAAVTTPDHEGNVHVKLSGEPHVNSASMRKIVTIAGAIGLNVGMCWALMLDPAAASHRALTPFWTAILWTSCPSIVAIRIAWWIVPILNAILYAAIALAIHVVRTYLRPFAN